MQYSHNMSTSSSSCG